MNKEPSENVVQDKNDNNNQNEPSQMVTKEQCIDMVIFVEKEPYVA